MSDASASLRRKISGAAELQTVVRALAWELVETYLAARFSGAERHRRRLSKVAALESKEGS